MSRRKGQTIDATEHREHVVGVSYSTAPYAHPIQPIERDDQGVVRFKANAIVRYLLDHGGIGMNKLAALSFSDEDRMQFAQLIGYSVGGFADLSYVSDEVYDAANKAAQELYQPGAESERPEPRSNADFAAAVALIDSVKALPAWSDFLDGVGRAAIMELRSQLSQDQRDFIDRVHAKAPWKGLSKCPADRLEETYELIRRTLILARAKSGGDQ